MIPRKHLRNMDDWWNEYERAWWAFATLTVRKEIWKKHIFWLRCIKHRLIGYNCGYYED